MSYFAELDDNNLVLRVVVIHETDATDGGTFCQSLFGGRWIETFDDGDRRKQYAGIGFAYDPDDDVFIAPQPYPSWSLDDNNDWQAPTLKPDGNYQWNEAMLVWEELQPIESETS